MGLLALILKIRYGLTPRARQRAKDLNELKRLRKRLLEARKKTHWLTTHSGDSVSLDYWLGERLRLADEISSLCARLKEDADYWVR